MQPLPIAPTGRLFWVKPAVVALVAHLALIAAYLGAFHGDASALVCVGRDKIGRRPFEAVRVGFAKGGYDGQFYYVIARSPWRRNEASIDAPALRHARILFPALGWLISGGGDPRRLLWALPVLNLASIAGLAALGAVWAGHHGRRAMWGCLLPIVVNAGTPALRDLTDPLATLAVAGLVVSWLLEYGTWTVCVWACAAVLSREQNVAIVGIVFFDAFLRRRWGVCACLAAVLTGWLAFVGILRAVYGVWPFYGNNLNLPFMGMIERLAEIHGGGNCRSLPIHALGIAFLLLQIGLTLFMIVRRPPRTLLFVALAGAVLAVLGGNALYESGHAYLRVFNWMPLGIWLWSMQSQRRWPVWLLTPALLWPCFALMQVWRAPAI